MLRQGDLLVKRLIMDLFSHVKESLLFLKMKLASNIYVVIFDRRLRDLLTSRQSGNIKSLTFKFKQNLRVIFMVCAHFGLRLNDILVGKYIVDTEFKIPRTLTGNICYLGSY